MSIFRSRVDVTCYFQVLETSRTNSVKFLQEFKHSTAQVVLKTYTYYYSKELRCVSTYGYLCTRARVTDVVYYTESPLT